MSKLASVQIACTAITGCALWIMHKRLSTLESAIEDEGMAAGGRAVADANAREHHGPHGHLSIVEGR